MAFQNMQSNDEEQAQQEEEQQQENQQWQQKQKQPPQEPPPKRLDARPKNNIYAPGTGKGTGRTAVRIGTINRDGSTSPVSALGAATGPLSQPLPRYSADQLQQMKDSNSAGFGTRPGRLDARPRNNIYQPGTGPGTGRTAIRVGTINRDGSTSPVSGLGAATGPLSQPLPRYLTPRPTPANAYAQRQGNVANAKANGTFDAARQKFNAANSGQIMDENGNIAKNPNASPPTQFDQVPDGLGGYKMVPVPPKKTPAPGAAATAGQPDTIKTGTEQFGKSAQSMEIPKPAPLVPPVIGSPLTPPPTPAESPIAPPVTASSAPSSSLGMPGTGTLGASTQQFGSPASTTPTIPAAESSPESTDPAGGDDEEKDDPEPRAKGGPVKAGKPYLVGEKGPEIIVPKRSGTVVPNHAITAAALRAAAGAQSQQRARFLTLRQTPAEAYSQMRVNRDSIIHRQASAAASAKKDSTKSHANAPRSRFFEARPTPVNAADYLRGRHLPGRADGGPVQADKPYVVGERGPEIIVPKKSGTGAPNHAMNSSSADSLQILHPEWQRPAAVPPMDTLASIAPQRRGDAGGQDPAAKEWMDQWQKRDVDRAEKARPAGHVQIEHDLGLTSVRHMLKGEPTGLADEFGTGISEGGTRVGQLAASVGSYLPGQLGRDYEARRKVYAERAEIMKKYRERDKAAQESFHSLTPGKLVATGVAAIPEIYNPANKAGWGAKAINATWHGVRGYLPNKSVHDGVVSALSSVAGENAEDLIRKGKTVAGNVAGAAVEKILDAVLPDDKAESAPPSVPGPIPRPVYGSGPHPMPMPGLVIKPTQAAAPVPKKKEEKKINGYEIERMKKKIPPSLRPMQKFDPTGA